MTFSPKKFLIYLCIGGMLAVKQRALRLLTEDAHAPSA